MAIKKSDLYSSIWKSCDELRGGMDASQYKDYVLVLLFVKYVSDKYAGQRDSLIVVPAGGSFKDMVALKGKPDIGDKINKIIASLAEENGLKGVIDVADFNDEDKLGKGKDMVDKLSRLVAIFENSNLDFSKNRADGDDLLGDAYEYLMRFFATESGKSKGQFFTPAEVSRIMAKVLGIGPHTKQDQTVYDPTCGSGSLLLKAADEAPRGLTIYGQEMDNATRALARMNMILHNNADANIVQGNTLANPLFLDDRTGGLKTFDFAVANPPFSSKAWSNGFNPSDDIYRRFGFGVPPDKNGDYAFLLHLLTSLKSTGRGAILLPHGVLFRGNAEANIRKALVRRGYIKAIIGLPPNLLYGTGIPACILVVDKEHAAGRTGIFMIDASKGFVKDGNKNRLRHQDLHKVVDVFTRQLEVKGYSRMVRLDEIADPKNDYNLNLPRYIDGSEPEDLHDLTAHLRGGIPNADVDALAAYWQVLPALRAELYAPLDGRPGYSQMRIEAAQVKPVITAYPEFVAYAGRVRAAFEAWQVRNRPCLQGIGIGTRPKELIVTLSEDMLAAFFELPLVDPYDLYQRLMTYWTEVMQDDVYLIAGDGWQAAAQLRRIQDETKDKADKSAKNTEKPDLQLGKLKFKADLIPPALVIARYFVAEQRELEVLEAEREALASQLEALKDEHSGEGGLLEAAQDDEGKLTRVTVRQRLRQLDAAPNPNDADERRVLDQFVTLTEAEVEAGAKVKAAQTAMTKRVIAQYAQLSEAEVRVLVVDDKWLAVLSAEVEAEITRVTQTLTGRVRTLAERYAAPLSLLDAEVDVLGGKVDAHLKRMGVMWE